MSEPDWESFAKAVLTDWPTGDLDGSVLFDLSLQYGMIQEVPGGYNSDHHIDAEGICPEEGDPWYEYTFRGEAGPGLYSITDMDNRIEELEAQVKEDALQYLSDTGQMSETIGDLTRRHEHALRKIDVLEDQLAKAVEAGVDVAASLNAAISILERGGKKAAASDKMFAQMLVDYNASLDRLRNTLAELT